MRDPEHGPYLRQDEKVLEARWLDLMDHCAEIQHYAEMTDDDEAWADLDAINHELEALEREMTSAGMVRIGG